MKASGIILAGGQSRRMGADKTLLKVKDETLIERTVKEMKKAVDDIIIASNHNAKYGIPGTIEVFDSFPGTGPIGGIHAGLQAAWNPVALVVAADMPMFDARLARFLLDRFVLEHNAGYSVVVPEINGHWEPLCGVYSRSCMRQIEEHLRAGESSVFGLFSRLKARKVTSEELGQIGDAAELFCNLNTPDDFRLLNERYGPGKGTH